MTISLVLMVATCPSRSTGEEPAPPNILWLTCEDLSPRLGCYGDSTIETSNIDQLAQEGVRFTNAFTTTGVCAPCRYSIITGLYPMQGGAQYMRTMKRSGAVNELADEALREAALARPLYEATPPVGVRCFTEFLRMRGYYCTNNSKEDYQFNAPVTAWDESSSQAHYKNRQPGQPFFAVFNQTCTHESKLHGKRKNPKVADRSAVRVPSYLPDTPVVREDIARQYDNVAVLDRWVGEKLSELETSGLSESTIVFFYSDHGDGLPRHKRWVYDSGTRIPLIVRHPDRRRAGEMDDRMISSIDLAPTCLALANIERPDYMPGRSFLANRDLETPYAYMHRDRMDDVSHETIRSVRGKRFRYVRNYRPNSAYLQTLPYRDRIKTMSEIHRLRVARELTKSQWQWAVESKPIEELYDTQTDPEEVTNLASDPAHFGKLIELRTALEDWEQRIDDPLAMDEAQVLRQFIWPPSGEQSTTAPPVIEVSLASNGKRWVEITTATQGASIGFRNESGVAWQVYTKPFALESCRNKIEAVAHRIGWKPTRSTWLRD